MAAKVLGRHSAAAGVPANLVVGSVNGEVFNVKVVNNSTTNSAKIKISTSTGSGSHQDAGREYPEDKLLAPLSMVQLTGFVCSNGFFTVVESDIMDVNFVASGVQT
jgi:hypothetical protein